MSGRPTTLRDGERKVCTKCRTLTPRSRFASKRRAADGLRSQCKACDADARKAHRASPHVAAATRAYKQRSKARIRELERARRNADIEHHRALQRRQRSSSAARARRRSYLARPEVRERVLRLRRLRRAETYRANLREQLNVRMSNLIRRSIKTGKNSRSWRALVDYDIDQLRRHLQRQFTPGMDWQAFLRGEIHIDHIRPIASFAFQDAADPAFMACWGLPNLRPLWASDNHAKRARREFLL